MNTPLTILEKYADAFRDMVNDKNRVSDKTVKELLRLTKEEDWAFICTAMDIVSDALLAIDNFLKYGLDGPTKFNDIGEKYLRLYGILNSTYIQQQALINLYKLNNVPNPAEIRKKVEKLNIRVVRHKLGSHSNDYLNPETGVIETYVPVRATLMGFNCEFMNNETLEWEKINLKEAIEDHLSMMIDISDKIYEKSITTFFKGYQKKQDKAKKHLEHLRLEKQGHLVIDSADGESKIIIRLMKSDIQPGHGEGRS